MRDKPFPIVRSLALLLLTISQPARATEPEAQGAAGCATHLVAPNESLHLISVQHFGNGDSAGAIWRANRRIIGANPDLIVPGMSLTVPCADTVKAEAEAPVPASALGQGLPDPVAPRNVGSAAGIAVARAGEAPATVPADTGNAPKGLEGSATTMPDDNMQPVHALTGAPYVPFVDPSITSGGMTAALLRAAYAATPGAPLKVDFVDDRDSHLSVILPRGGFALSFPWIYPDCAAPGADRQAALLCADYIASDSLYEHVTEFFARADSDRAGILSPDQLTGSNICRPAGYPVGDLRAFGLSEDDVSVVRSESPAGCLEMLDRGEVDVASLDATLARALVARIQLKNPLVVLESLTRIHRLRAVARRDDPRGAVAIRRLNEGLSRIVETGDWLDIVNQHLGAP